MSRTRRAATLAAVAAVGIATAAAATPAAATPQGPHPVTTWLTAVRAHEATWVSVFWMTGRKICDAEVTVEGDDVRVGYPSDTDTYTSFSRSDDLGPWMTDFTAFRVRPDRDWAAFVPLEATLTYNTCGSHAVEKAKTYRLTLPVLPG